MESIYLEKYPIGEFEEYNGAPALPRILSPRDFLAKKKIAPNLNNTEKQKLEMPRT